MMEPPNFRSTSLWPNGCIDQDATWYGDRPRPTRHCVRCGPSYPQKKRHLHPTQFLANIYCGQMAGWMKTQLGTAVRPRPRTHCTRRGLSSRKIGTAAPPLFSAHVYCGHGRPSQLLAELSFELRFSLLHDFIFILYVYWPDVGVFLY